MTSVYIIFGMFLITFGIRFGFIAFATKISLSDEFKKLLEFVPPCVLTAIVVPGVLFGLNGKLDISPDNHFLIASVCAVVVSRLSKNLLFTILSSMLVYLIHFYNA